MEMGSIKVRHDKTHEYKTVEEIMVIIMRQQIIIGHQSITQLLKKC